jgi:hypothetical protein
MNKEMLKFMATFFANEEVWISDDLETPTETDGFKFEKKKFIKGVVVFGDKYPLSNRDLSVEDHLSVWNAIKNTKVLGVILYDAFGKEGQKMYVDDKGRVQFI